MSGVHDRVHSVCAVGASEPPPGSLCTFFLDTRAVAIKPSPCLSLFATYCHTVLLSHVHRLRWRQISSLEKFPRPPIG